MINQEVKEIEVNFLKQIFGGEKIESIETKKTFKFVKLSRVDRRCTPICFKMLDLFENVKSTDGKDKLVANINILIPIIELVVDTLMICDTPQDTLDKMSLLQDNIGLARFAQTYTNEELFPFFLTLKGILFDEKKTTMMPSET